MGDVAANYSRTDSLMDSTDLTKIVMVYLGDLVGTRGDIRDCSIKSFVGRCGVITDFCARVE